MRSITALLMSFMILAAVFLCGVRNFPVYAAMDPSFQPAAPYYATFFYLWSQNPNTDSSWSYWSDNAHTPPDNWFSHYLPDPQPGVFNPSEELYSSNNTAIIYWQLRKLAEARQEVAIASWWGQGHKSDIAFQKIITDIMNRPDNPYPHLRWAMYYEKEGFGDVPLTEIVNDLAYIKATYANQPGYLKINGKPVIFVYNAAHSGSTPANDLQRWQSARSQSGFYIVLKVDPLNSGADPASMDGWHEYAPANRSGSKGSYYSFASPGFWLEGQAQRLPRNLTEFETAVRQMVAANTTWKLTQTWNEWGEGSSVEPAVEVNQVSSGKATIKIGAPLFENKYVDILAVQLPPLERGAGGLSPSLITPSTIIPSVTTPPSITPTSVSDPVVVAVGDIACGGDSPGASCKEWETSELARQQNPAAVLVLGDNQYESGKYQYFSGADPYCKSNPPRCYDTTWGRLKNITYPSVGNHEYLTTDASGYFDYFNGIGNAAGRAGDRSKGFYSFDIGAWHLIALNSNCSRAGGCGVNSPQERWLRQDLASNKNKCTLAYMHHPRYSSGYDGNNSGLTGQLVPLWQALQDNQADIVLAGHSHHYERFAPQDAAGNANTLSGIRQFVVGTGGRNFTGYWTNTLANSEVKNNTSFGVLSLTLHNNSYDWKFIPVASGSFTDAGTTTCHAVSAISPTIFVTQAPQPCVMKMQGDADCKRDIEGKDVNLLDFEVWRKESFADCSSTNEIGCGIDNDADGNVMDANFNYPGSTHTVVDMIVNLQDFEIWRKGYYL